MTMNTQLFIATVWIARVSSTLSLLGSCAIIYIIISARKRKLTRPKNRLMLMMSFFDVLQSIAMVIATAAIPRETGIYGSVGNNVTCQIQGIFMILGISVPLYNTSLNLFYLLSIRYNMDPERFSHRIEPILHAISILGPTLFAAIYSTTGSIKPSGTACIVPMDSSCVVFGILFTFCVIFSLFSMSSIAYMVYEQSKNIRRYMFRQQSSTILEERETIIQALLYASAFLLTFTFPYIQAFYFLIKGEFSPALAVFTAIFYPLQGFWNFLFYIRPGVKHVRNIDPSKSLIGAVREVIFNTESVANSFLNNSGSRSRRVNRKSNKKYFSCSERSRNTKLQPVQVDPQRFEDGDNQAKACADEKTNDVCEIPCSSTDESDNNAMSQGSVREKTNSMPLSLDTTERYIVNGPKEEDENTNDKPFSEEFPLVLEVEAGKDNEDDLEGLFPLRATGRRASLITLASVLSQASSLDSDDE